MYYRVPSRKRQLTGNSTDAIFGQIQGARMSAGRPPNEDSATRQLANLAIGECYARAAVISAWLINPNTISDTQHSLRRTVDTAIVRARHLCPGHAYRTHSTHAFTAQLDVIVTVAAIREA
jgi:hypothetical protein